MQVACFVQTYVEDYQAVYPANNIDKIDFDSNKTKNFGYICKSNSRYANYIIGRNALKLIKSARQ